MQALQLAAPDAVTARVPLTADEEATVSIFRRNKPSVVYITNLANRQAALCMRLELLQDLAGSYAHAVQAGHIHP